MISKYIITYTLCFIAFMLCYGILGEGEMQRALLFQVLLFWLLNELWFFLSALPALMAAIFKWATRREHETERSVRRIVRLTSVSLILLPHGVFALLYLCNRLTQGGFQESLGLPLSQGLFVSAYVGCVMLFITALFTPIHALTLTHLFEGDKSADHRSK